MKLLRKIEPTSPRKSQPRGSLDGPSKTITVEPVEAPIPAPPPEVKPEPSREPQRPAPAPPAPAR